MAKNKIKLKNAVVESKTHEKREEKKQSKILKELRAIKRKLS